MRPTRSLAILLLCLAPASASADPPSGGKPARSATAAPSSTRLADVDPTVWREPLGPRAARLDPTALARIGVLTVADLTTAEPAAVAAATGLTTDEVMTLQSKWLPRFSVGGWSGHQGQIPIRHVVKAPVSQERIDAVQLAAVPETVWQAVLSPERAKRVDPSKLAAVGIRTVGDLRSTSAAALAKTLDLTPAEGRRLLERLVPIMQAGGMPDIPWLPNDDGSW